MSIDHIDFKENVPVRHRKELEDRYRQYVLDNMIFTWGNDLQVILAEWVSYGNDPYKSNRYGFYDTKKQKYLDFVRGECKTVQLLEIMFGIRSFADCSYNQFGEPEPRSGAYQLKFTETEIFKKRYRKLSQGLREILFDNKTPKKKDAAGNE